MRTDDVTKHLEMIQNVVSRLGRDSFFVKGWSMAIVTAATLILARTESSSAVVVLALFVPVLGFWILDGYFLMQERLFRNVYDDVRARKDTDFGMNVSKFKNRSSWLRSMFSVTLNIFYGMEIFFVLLVFLFLKISAVTDCMSQTN